jgi:hypothetical protein
MSELEIGLFLCRSAGHLRANDRAREAPFVHSLNRRGRYFSGRTQAEALGKARRWEQTRGAEHPGWAP